MREKIRILSFGLALWLLPLSTSVKAFSSLFVYGDSLSDTGNAFLGTGEVQEVPFGGLVPDRPYSVDNPDILPRLSNGPVWVEYLADDMGLSAEPFLGGGTNFAFGGALTGPQPTLPESSSPSLLEQLGLSQTVGDVSPDALYIVYGGGNDARRAAQQMLGGEEAEASATVEQGVTNLTQIVSFLASSGAENFLIPNLPDLGLTPEARRGSVGLAEASTTVSTEFNTLLAQALLQFQNEPINLSEVDTFEFTRNIINSPENFGLPASFNTTEPCIEPASVCDNPNERFFYDGIHPTTVGHREFAQVASQQLQPVPEPLQPVPEPSTLVGSLAVGLAAIWRRRKQRLN